MLVLSQSPWALLWAAAFAAAHLPFTSRREWLAVLLTAGFGIIVDSLWHMSAAVTYAGSGWPLPFWLLGLWLMFPLTMNHGLAWLKGRPVLQIVCGIFGGGGSYLAGMHLGAASMQPAAQIILPLLWGLWLPLFYYAHDRLLNRTLPEYVFLWEMRR